MTSLHSPSSPQNPPQTFLDKKPPLLPRQSTSDVLSFTHIITNRLRPGQNVWDFFSPAPPPDSSDNNSCLSPTSIHGPVSPTSMLSPTSPVSPTFGSFQQSTLNNNTNKRHSLLLDSKPSQEPIQDHSPLTCSSSPPLAITTPFTPKTQKRRSFAQSLKSSMLSLTQLLSPTSSASSRLSSPTGPPHYNILVLGSDSAPLASTLYKMSSLLPCTTKISHYQEISGFFVAYFRSNASFSCSPRTITEAVVPVVPGLRVLDEVKPRRRKRSIDQEEEEGKEEEGSEEEEGGVESKLNSQVKAKTVGMSQVRPSEESMTTLFPSKSSEETTRTLLGSSSFHTQDGSESTIETIGDDEDDEFMAQQPQQAQQHEEPEIILSSSANASLSVHAFSLDTTWPVPRILAQTFWFPFAHGIIYIVDATRKNDPRGMDHLLNARQFLASLIADPHFRRKDIPVVVFANKAGLDPETCYRVDEIAEILGCEEWDGGMMDLEAGARPWCVKSTRSDGAGDGLRESVEWLKSRMGEVWKS